jgi:hypothetical protein
MGSVGRTWNRDGTALQMPTEQNLIGRLVVSLGDAGDDLMLREGLNTRSATTQREPSFEDSAHLGNVSLHATALMVGMCLVLQHSWFDGGNLHHAVNVVLIENALCALLGRYSGHIERGDFLTSCEQMPLITQVNIQALATRPDIRQAEAALKKAFYLTNNARAAFYPSLNLSGIIGWTNDLDEVVSPAGLLMRALGSLTQPVFAKGKPNKKRLRLPSVRPSSKQDKRLTMPWLPANTPSEPSNKSHSRWRN